MYSWDMKYKVQCGASVELHSECFIEMCCSSFYGLKSKL